MKIVVNSMVWLPKGTLDQKQLNRVRNRLTVWRQSTSEFGSDGAQAIKLYSETNLAIGVPRGYFEEHLIHYQSDNEVMCSDGAPMSDFSSLMKFTGPFKEQGEALKVMSRYCEEREWGGFLLKAGCGFGKTNTALAFAHKLGRRTLILVHKEFFLTQWRDRIREFMPQAKIGFIQGSTCDYEGKDFVIGMMQSLALDKKGKYPKAVYSAFGLVISDECHRIGAQTWANLIPKFNSRWRLGLTATPRRKDGAENVFFYHIGKVLYSATSQSLIPKLRKCFTSSVLKEKKRGRSSLPANRLSHVEIVTQLCEDEERSSLISEMIFSAAIKGRKVMVISERKKHLESLHEAILEERLKAVSKADLERAVEPRSVSIDYYIGGRKEAELAIAEQANIVLATKQMVEEGLDIPAIDVLFLTTPMSDVEQTVGRVRRHCKPSKSKCEHLCKWRSSICEGKPKPILVDVVDRSIPQCRRKFLKRYSFYKEIGMKV